MLKKKRWKKASQGAFLYKLGLLLNQGYTINKSVELLKSQLPKNKQNLLDEMLDLLASGSPIIDIFSKLYLPNEVVSSLSINSSYGNLTGSLIANGSFLKKKAEWSERLNKTIRYPLFLIFLTTWIGIIFYQFLYPQFSILFSSLEVKTPAFTSLMLTFLKFIPFVVLSMLLLFLSGWIILYMIRKKSKFSTQMTLLMYIPIFKTFLILMNSHFFSTTFGTMLKSGLPVTDALLVMEKHLNKGFYQEESIRLQKGLLDGKSFPDLLLDKPYFTKELAEIVRFGQAHGDLGAELIQYGEWIFIELEERIMSFLQKLQPVLFAIIGGFVLMMFASMMLPMFKLMEAL